MQLYTALIYRGLGLIGEIKSELLGALVGTAKLIRPGRHEREAITAEPWPG